VPELGSLHPATRLGRVLQQLRSFARLHSDELGGVIEQLEAREQPDLAASLRAYRRIHEQEASMVLDELTDIQTGLVDVGQETRSPPDRAATPVQPESSLQDPAAESPKRARWLAQQSQRAKEAISRRAFFSRRAHDPVGGEPPSPGS